MVKVVNGAPFLSETAMTVRPECTCQCRSGCRCSCCLDKQSRGGSAAGPKIVPGDAGNIFIAGREVLQKAREQQRAGAATPMLP